MVTHEDLARQFTSWADRVMIEHGSVVVSAYNFNLYEHHDSFAVQLIGAARYDPVDSSWASEERFSSGEDLFDLPHALVGDDWRGGLAAAKSLVSSYLQAGTQAASQVIARCRGRFRRWRP